MTSGTPLPSSVLEINIVHGDALSMTTRGRSRADHLRGVGYLGKGSFTAATSGYDTLIQMSSFGEDTLFADLGKHEIFTPDQELSAARRSRSIAAVSGRGDWVRLCGRRNPDVLTCIANLSNDEVFTPPEFANRMLDTLAEAWADANGARTSGATRPSLSSTHSPSPACSCGRSPARLTQGLEDEIPDLQERVDHILTKQVFGIGITLPHQPYGAAQRLLLEARQR